LARRNKATKRKTQPKNKGEPVFFFSVVSSFFSSQFSLLLPFFFSFFALSSLLSFEVALSALLLCLDSKDISRAFLSRLLFPLCSYPFFPAQP
jgi:hypothetical protein